jgi:hypothetical protein
MQRCPSRYAVPTKRLMVIEVYSAGRPDACIGTDEPATSHEWHIQLSVPLTLLSPALQPEKSSEPEPSDLTVRVDVDWRSESKTSTKPPCSMPPMPICTVPVNIGVDRFVYVPGPW